jgi:tRNA(Ile2) C34 agmatinyltransferase TiaS
MGRRYSFAAMPARQKYRLRARSDREVVREVEPGVTYVDHTSGEEFQVVGAVVPLAPSPSDLPYAVENLRLCGCSLEQLVQKDLNDCPHCGRRMSALER